LDLTGSAYSPCIRYAIQSLYAREKVRSTLQRTVAKGKTPVRRENDRFSSPPMHGCHYTFSKSVRVLIAKLRLCFVTSAIVLSKTSGVIFCPVVSGVRRFVSMSRRAIISTNSGLTGGSPESRTSSSRISCRMNSPRWSPCFSLDRQAVQLRCGSASMTRWSTEKTRAAGLCRKFLRRLEVILCDSLWQEFLAGC
jgi:hypothetical protein